MLKLLKYSSLLKLNNALKKFEKKDVPVKKVKLITVGETIVYFALIDTTNLYQKHEEIRQE
jgi:hypothetical protein